MESLRCYSGGLQINRTSTDCDKPPEASSSGTIRELAKIGYMIFKGASREPSICAVLELDLHQVGRAACPTQSKPSRNLEGCHKRSKKRPNSWCYCSDGKL
ncbi:hypothetical protein EVAR_66200_1 [Eumeta japonica]|uniref:Uncharacterized protein n=1 Tax=Eumeta variegata TaxID=151549 RepID=A0A4C1ZM69_EUMVA|nr:hypothetical protein EVAR_66200_1 [Eumeta japonica]